MGKPTHYLVRYTRADGGIDRLIVKKPRNAKKEIDPSLILSVVPIWEIKTGKAYK